MAAPPQLGTEWYTFANPDVLLNIVCPREGSYSSMVRVGTFAPPAFRRLQLLGCACARMVWDYLPTDARSAVVVRERYADGRATETDLRAAAMRSPFGSLTAQQRAEASAAYASGYRWTDQHDTHHNWAPDEAARESAKARASRAAGPSPASGSPFAHDWHAAWNRTFAEARAHQAELVRDIFPPPGYVPVLHPDWPTSTAVALARQMDEAGEYSALPILADALQDAGCDNDIMLDRCRAPSGIHCRGNWVVDLVLGRE